MVSFVGSANGSTGNTGTVFVALKPYSQRKSTADEIVRACAPSWRRSRA